MSQTLSREIELAIRSRFPVICIQTMEEERLLEVIQKHCEVTSRPLYLWDHADFFQVLVDSQTGESPREPLPSAKDPLSLLEVIEKTSGTAVFILGDFHQCWHNQPRVIRKLRNLSHRLKYTRITLILSMPCVPIPPELRDDIVILELPPPNLNDLDEILANLMKTPGVKSQLTPEGRRRLLNSALGLSASQALRVFSKALVTDGVLDDRDLGLVTSEKKQIIKDSGSLEYYSATETPADVGGLENLKEWLRRREGGFSSEAKDYGLPSPRGVALIGIPGTGKSLSAKMIAGLWGLPLVRLDIGALFGSLVGQSEENARKALRLAETISPCVLWIDEVEKGLSIGGGDGGTSMRVFGSILSWMQERTKPVFTVATANNISMLPPELLRRGRFDEIFFLDLPTTQERREIFSVHLRKRGRNPGLFDLDRLADSTAGFVGAEIEQAVIDAMFDAFSDREQPGREFDTDDIQFSCGRLVPLSRSAREVINSLRLWLSEGRAVSASFSDTQEAKRVSLPVALDIGTPSPSLAPISAGTKALPRKPSKPPSPDLET